MDIVTSRTSRGRRERRSRTRQDRLDRAYQRAVRPASEDPSLLAYRLMPLR